MSRKRPAEWRTDARGNLIEGHKRSLTETMRALLGRREGRPDADDYPPVSTLPGRKHKPLRGQLDIDGREHDAL